MHRLWVENAELPVGQELEIDGDEAAHALRVKRVRPDEQVELLDGRGVVVRAVVLPGTALPSGKRAHREAALRVRVLSVTRHEHVSPNVEVYTATPKGGRADELVDHLSQVGAAAWGPLSTSRGVDEPGAHKLDRLERISREACKQSGRAWQLDVLPAIAFAEALRSTDGRQVLVCDGAGEVFDTSSRAGKLRVLIGPEGGWTSDELALAKREGARITRFGPHTMRIETAAVIAAGVVLHAARVETRPLGVCSPDSIPET